MSTTTTTAAAATTTSEEELLCSYCFEMFTDPLVLKCGHSLCKECVEKMVNYLKNVAHFNQASASSCSKSTSPSTTPSLECIRLKCPTCNQETLLDKVSSENSSSALQPNRSLNNLVVKKRELDAKKKLCSMECGKEATICCERCERNLFCEECFVNHLKGPYKSHSASPISNNPIIKCHDCSTANPKIFCKTCKLVICSDCAHFGNKHKGHECVLLNEYLPVIKKEIDELVDQLKTKRNSLEESVKEIEIQEKELARKKKAALELQETVSSEIKLLESHQQQENVMEIIQVSSILSNRFQSLDLKFMKLKWDSKQCGNQLVITENGLVVSKPSTNPGAHQQSSVLGNIKMESGMHTWTIEIAGLKTDGYSSNQWVLFGVSDGIKDQNNANPTSTYFYGWSTNCNQSFRSANNTTPFNINATAKIEMTFDSASHILTAKCNGITNTIYSIPSGVFPALNICYPGNSVRILEYNFQSR